MEKENRNEISNHYEQWTEKELNERILALYDQIEQVTIQNLEVAQKNSELEIQIKTIDGIIQSQTPGGPMESISRHRSQEDLEEKYGTLLFEHKQLAQRVSQI